MYAIRSYYVILSYPNLHVHMRLEQDQTSLLCAFLECKCRITSYNVCYTKLLRIAGSLAFKKGAQEAGLVLLEPHVNMEIRVGKDHVGDVMGDLNSRRGKVMGMDSDGRSEIINAQVPQSEMLSYATDLTSMTGGLGTFTYQFSHYEEVPSHIAEKIIAERAEDE